MVPTRPLLIIACGALAREIGWVVDANKLTGVDLTCLPAELHNRPKEIPGQLRRKIEINRGKYDRIVALYGDCGTGGELDELLAAEGVERIAGEHCYAFFAGRDSFDGLMAEELGSFFLTDYLARVFDRLIIQGLGIDRHPELLPMYFDNYRRLVYLAQTEDADLQAKAEAAARRLGLDYVYRFTGMGELAGFVTAAADKAGAVTRKV
ncbi:MAG: DUF1638 domain-containing protein [Proteobacteria bacterium]|nr:DUF1638 domain-containing protein [Pseudomonadota bacterium]